MAVDYGQHWHQNLKAQATQNEIMTSQTLVNPDLGDTGERESGCDINGDRLGVLEGDDSKKAGPMALLNSPTKQLSRVLLSTSTPFSDTIIRSLFRDPDIELRLITDKGFGDGDKEVENIQCYSDNPQGQTGRSRREWMNVTAASLADWADIFIAAPADAGTLGSMVMGLTTSLTLTILRGWDVSKTVLLVPKMSLLEWKAPMTKRQLDDIQEFWPWVKILPPVLSRFERPNALVEMPWEGRKTFFAEIRKGLGWPFIMNSEDAVIDPETYAIVTDSRRPSKDRNRQKDSGSQQLRKKPTTKPITPSRNPKDPILPPELLTMVFEALNDWEVATAVGVYARIPIPDHWKPFFPKSSAPSTPLSLEYTILRRPLKEITQQLDSAPGWKSISNIAAHLILKFSRTDVLDYITTSRIDLFWSTPRLANFPFRVSSMYGNTTLLDWWRNCPELPTNDYLPDAIDAASRAGFVHVLQWWRNSGLPLRYTERALESASAGGQIAVLDWWKMTSESSPDYDPIPLKIGKSVLLAAQSGRTASLAWWDKSGIPYTHGESVARIASTHGHVPVLELWYRLKGSKIIFDNQVLVGATKNGHVDVLEWWRRSGLRVEFKTCDIEEALEDAVSGAEERVRRWWERNGLNLGVGTSEWMKVKVL